MLDVHVLTLPGLPEEWIKQRRDSIDAAVAAAGFPVYVHEVEGIYGHMGRSRFKGYSQGAQPYVTHVDDDDWVEEDVFSTLLPYMESNATGITVGGIRHHPMMEPIPSPELAQYPATYKREWLEAQDYGKFEFFPDQYLLIKCVDLIHVPKTTYNFRIHNESFCSKHNRSRPAEAMKELKLLKQYRKQLHSRPQREDT